MRVSRLLPLLFALPLVGQPTKRPMTFEDLQAIKRVADPQVSPSGKWVLFSVTEVDLAANKKVNHLWSVSIDGKVKEKKVTDGKGEGGGRFSPDGKQVLYTAGGQIWLAPWNEERGTIGKAKQLTDISTEADNAIWSPDGKSIAFASDVYPECEQDGYDAACNKAKDDAAEKSPVKALIFDELLYRHWDHYQGNKRSHILLVSSTDGKQIRDLTPTRDIGTHVAPTYNASIGAFSPDSKEFAYVVNLDKDPSSSTNNDIYTIQLADAKPVPVKISTSPGSDDAPVYSPDGKYLAYRSQARNGYESDRFRLMLYNRSTKVAKELLPNFDRWVDEDAWSPDSKHIFFSFGDGGSGAIFEGDVESFAATAMQTARGREYSNLQVTSDGKFLIAAAMGVRMPTQAIAIDLTKINPAPLAVGDWEVKSTFSIPTKMKLQNGHRDVAVITHVSADLLAQLDLIHQESFKFTAADGTPVEGFIVRPPNFDPNKKYPLKFLIHGGPQGAWGDAWSYRWNPELFAANGYVVVMINPRGSTGYGQKFIEGVSGDWGGKPFTDLMAGLDYAEKKYPFIDKTRECALGASYGGFMANWILTHTNRFACIVTHDGMYEPVSAYGSTEEMWFNEWEFRQRKTDAKGNYDFGSEPAQPWRYQNLPASEDPFRKFSPALNIAKAKTPTLIIHGQKDYRLDVSQGFQLFTALQRRGVPGRMLYFPDEGHWVLKPQNSQLWYETVNDWCDKWTHTNKYAEAR